MKALIAGSSGLVGSELIKLLVEQKEYAEIHVLIRRSLDLESHKVVEHIINFGELENLEIDSKAPLLTLLPFLFQMLV